MSQTITVTNLADNKYSESSVPGSLREAIEKANPGDTIQFAPRLAQETIILERRLEIEKDLTIDAADAPGLTISGNQEHQIFRLSEKATDVTFRNLTLVDAESEYAGAAIWSLIPNVKITVENSHFYNNIAGQGPAIWAKEGADVTVINSIFDGNHATTDVDSAGGAISVFTKSKLTVKGSEFTNNKGFAGGAITTIFTPLTIEDSIFRNNQSRSWGGAVNNDGASVPFQERYYDGDLPRDKEGGETIIRNTVFDGNRSVFQGGGLALFGYDQDYITIEDSTFINNEVIQNQEGIARGGGLRVAGFVTIKNTTVANNRSHEEGGGVWYQGEVPVTITNSTFSGNQAKDEKGAGFGGGIYSQQWGSQTNITNTTFANNYAGSEAGAIYATSQRHHLTNTIFYNNTAGNKSKIKQQTNIELIDAGNNLQYPDLVTDDPDDVNVTADIQIADPRLGDLQEIDGRLVHPLLEGSPAINAGTKKNAPKTDQRGLPRDDQYDIGAFEFAPTPVPSRGGDPSTGGDANNDDDNVSPPTSVTPVLNQTANDTLQITGNSESAQLQFTLTDNRSTFVNEIGIFYLDDEQGRVNGIAPGEGGYLNAVFSQPQVIVSTLSDNPFPELNLTRQLTVNVGSRIGFYFVRNSTTDTVLADLATGQTPSNVFFAFPDANQDGFDYGQISPQDDGRFILQWQEVQGGGNTDFDDLVLSVELSDTLPSLGTTFQGQPEGELIDLTGATNPVSADFVVNREADYDNSFGFYVVDDITGRIDNLAPGDPGYAGAAISQRLNIEANTLPGDVIIAPFIIADGTPEEFLAENPDNQPGTDLLAYFTYSSANPDRVDHVRLLGDNTFAFEDIFGGGDFDYDDLVVQVNFA
ncbi:DUF4114 domain-containing protein [Coleofasciculus sp. E2-BRE-01]|uniref:DUF4114 domain-containing protein n=1 Tax=Coleofasciculus sp. E2-BRE-01 TaxID=3069524 RepID=UPI0032F67801